ncbi:hypothetical protein [uncultured Thermanaerothrix sp.]|uniref:hypothetical protein n=1 Tax=uncultured Thermanaerothrix sp. TaxID=1195149 RepID=UPI00262E34A9|nr:hypothetical protein [uncultured Thermanaerothrix sp.]
MSQDWTEYLKNPFRLAWQPEVPLSDRMIYRLLDPPLTRYWIGFWLTLTNQPAPLQDWNWSQGWEANLQAGAFPPPTSLFVARLGMTLLLPISLLSIYALGYALRGRRVAWTSLFLAGGHALILLHTRRAMAEGLLLSGSTLTLWLLSLPAPNPWLLGLSAALAFNAKYTALPLVGLGVLRLGLLDQTKPTYTPKARLGAILAFLSAFTLLTLALNPFLWKHPVEALKQAAAARQHLITAQVGDFKVANPLMVAESTSTRLRNMLLQVFFAPPQLSEAANYNQALATSYNSYEHNPFHSLLRGKTGGGLILALTLLGMLALTLDRREALPSSRLSTQVLILGTIFQSGFFLGWLPLSFQRYYILLVPYVVLWTAMGIDSLLKALNLLLDQIWRK